MGIDLIGTPDNLRTRAKGPKLVESDVYNICNRIKEIDSNLFVVLHEDHDRPWVVMENCSDGQERMVSRYDRLDATIITDLQRMLHIPFETRIKKLMQEVDDYNEAQEHAWEESEQHEELIYNMGKALRESGLATGRIAPTYFRSK